MDAINSTSFTEVPPFQPAQRDWKRISKIALPIIAVVGVAVMLTCLVFESPVVWIAMGITAATIIAFRALHVKKQEPTEDPDLQPESPRTNDRNSLDSDFVMIDGSPGTPRSTTNINTPPPLEDIPEDETENVSPHAERTLIDPTDEETHISDAKEPPVEQSEADRAAAMLAELQQVGRTLDALRAQREKSEGNSVVYEAALKKSQ